MLNRQHSIITPSEPQIVNLRRSNSARSVDNQQYAYVPTNPTPPNEIRQLTRSISTSVGAVNRDNQGGNPGGVQRRLRQKTSDAADLSNRRPVSWHVDQMEAQVIAHLEKQKVLNGEVPPVNLRRASSGSRMADDQVTRASNNSLKLIIILLIVLIYSFWMSSAAPTPTHALRGRRGSGKTSFSALRKST